MSDDFVKSFGFVKEDTPRYIRQNYTTLINWCRFRLSKNINDEKEDQLPESLQELVEDMMKQIIQRQSVDEWLEE